MIFYSDKFYYNGIHSQDYNICLVSEETGVLNEYGISHNDSENEDEITLVFDRKDSKEYTKEDISRKDNVNIPFVKNEDAH